MSFRKSDFEIHAVKYTGTLLVFLVCFSFTASAVHLELLSTVCRHWCIFFSTTYQMSSASIHAVTDNDKLPVTHCIKFVMAGDPGVGKTAFIQRFRCLPMDSRPTIGVDFCTFHRMHPNGKSRVRIILWDVAGSGRFDTITRGYLAGAHGIILVYAINNKESFTSLAENWVPKIIQSNSSLHSDNNMVSDHVSRVGNEATAKTATKVPFESILIGNKIDLDQQRKVTYEYAQQYAMHNWHIPYVELSCKTDDDPDTFARPIDWLVSLILNNAELEKTTRQAARDTRKTTRINGNTASTCCLFFSETALIYLCAWMRASI